MFLSSRKLPFFLLERIFFEKSFGISGEETNKNKKRKLLELKLVMVAEQ